MLSLALLFGVISAALAATATAPFYGPCRNFTTVKVDTSIWEKSERWVNLHRYGEQYSCEYVWNRLIRLESGALLLHNTWARIKNGIDRTTGLHASFVRDGVYEFERFADDGTKTKFVANFLAYEKDLFMINVCSNDAKYTDGEDQVFIETPQSTAPIQLICKIKKVLEANKLNPAEFGLVNNCGCSNIPYDDRCKGYKAPSAASLFASCL